MVKFVRFETTTNDDVYVNPEYVIAVSKGSFFKGDGNGTIEATVIELIGDGSSFIRVPLNVLDTVGRLMGAVP